MKQRQPSIALRDYLRNSPRQEGRSNNHLIPKWAFQWFIRLLNYIVPLIPLKTIFLMKMVRFQLARVGLQAATALGLGTSLSGLTLLPLLTSSALAEEPAILQREAVLRPSYGEHEFSGKAGQAIAVTMTSNDFATVLSLVDPDGLEIAYSNSEPSSTSKLVAVLPADGLYVVRARSISGQESGDYTITVRDATPVETAYAEGLSLYYNGDYPGAMVAYDRAIDLDATQPEIYESRAQVLYAIAQQLRPEERDIILTNYRRALELYEQTGNTEAAQRMRDQMSYLETAPSY